MLGESVVNPVLPVADLARAKEFYIGRLGLKPAAEGESWVVFRTDGYWFALTVSTGAGSNQSTALEFLVEDLDAEMADLRSRGVVFEEYEFNDWATVNGVAEASEGRSAWFKDSEGNIIGVSEVSWLN